MQIELKNDSFLSSSEHAAPPKKPPRPGAHPAGVSGLNPTDSYNEGVKVPELPHGKLTLLQLQMGIVHVWLYNNHCCCF